MKRGWLLAAILGGSAGVTQAADVQLFGIHSPVLNKWQVYAQISNPASTDVQGANVAGLDSLSLDVLNNTAGGGTATVTASTNKTPFGTTNQTDGATPIGYGFYDLRSDGTVDGTGTHEIRGAQAAQLYSNPPFNQFVLSGVGLTAGTQAATGNFTSATKWTAPVLVGQGTYTKTGNTATGLTIQLTPGTATNLVRNVGTQAAPVWAIEAAASTTVIDSRVYTGINPSAVGTTTVKAGAGDADLSGNVDFNDLVKLAQNYNSTNATWFQGDFTMDGTVDFNDLVQLAQNYNKPVPSAPLGSSAAFQSDFAAAFAAVPEPGSLSLLMLVVGGGLMGRSRRCGSRGITK